MANIHPQRALSVSHINVWFEHAFGSLMTGEARRGGGGRMGVANSPPQNVEHRAVGALMELVQSAQLGRVEVRLVAQALVRRVLRVDVLNRRHVVRRHRLLHLQHRRVVVCDVSVRSGACVVEVRCLWLHLRFDRLCLRAVHYDVICRPYDVTVASVHDVGVWTSTMYRTRTITTMNTETGVDWTCIGWNSVTSAVITWHGP